MATPTNCKMTFFDLPRELRDSVYECGAQFTFTRTVDLALSRPITRYSNGSLLLTSCQSHNETAKLYYARTIFYATNVDKLFNWITALPDKYVTAIKNIRCTWPAAWIL
ncbi:hypothetical protein CLAFUW4_12485 [Fulvia fulva]|uniref:Uncharacterized protein n=1 Tax=Passalora fulva TaxID=5499 RepID=A0A9Q8PDI7_PASFU|nr:uncharacterized protein CLAFUR5_11512 [Fulvia fulva]KAK4617864.1 hypothetical protein CLAFUR4_12490 [Fulvia fulva]KAK4618863.1 hypothetical protein CLAFUR0_12501 [Fulvia fulva]UJO20541.1 hypothetical protein CLAFUR5_11512 [Fulvia fulva]WPV17798.1 hypothetical protein CLAFUW4_12485 [Fulvia fulva]WPV33624.1 hypothetical protein CLAFUW7_12492 [Fulvia fulva]